MKKIDHVLITGATGFLGSAIVAKAATSGLSVTATDRIGPATVSGVPFIAADILDPNSLSKIFEGIDCVCHAAGLAHIFNKSDAAIAPFHAVNVTGTDNVVRAAYQAGVCHFIFISSVSVYGIAAHDKNEDSESQPEGPYAMSKWQAEQRLIEYCQRTGMNLTILRLVALYGEGDPGNVARLIRQLARGRFIWIGDGSNRKSLLYKEDAARACLAVISQPVSGINIYNVSAPPYTMCEIVNIIVKNLGKNPLPVRIPSALALNMTNIMSKLSNQLFAGLNKIIQKWLAEDVYNTRRFEETYGFQAKTSLEDGLKREVDWYRREQRSNMTNTT